MNKSSNEWLSSKEAVKSAKIKDCDLMHFRLSGKLEYKKKGNAYFYTTKSVENLKKI